MKLLIITALILLALAGVVFVGVASRWGARQIGR